MFWLLKLAGMVTFELGATLNRNKPLLQKSRTQWILREQGGD
jgi:hypothetical protein